MNTYVYEVIDFQLFTASKCYGYQDNGWMVAGVSDALWNNGAACGRRYRVRCIGGANAAPHPCKAGSVVVKVVDYCRSVCYGDINLSQYAFSQIADVNAGKVRIEYYQYVSLPLHCSYFLNHHCLIRYFFLAGFEV